MTEPIKTEPTGETVALVSPSEIVTPLGDRMPQATEEAETSAPPKESPPPAQTGVDRNAGKRDARGTLWAGKRFQVNADGTPRLNAKGNFMFSAEYKGRTPKNPRVPFSGQPQRETDPAPPTFDTPGERPVDPNVRPSQDEYDLAAEVYLQSSYGPIIIAFSEHARPDNEDHAALKQSLANYLRVKQITEPSPGWALVIVAMAVAVKKSAHPEVARRAATWGERLKNWFNPQKFKAPKQVEASR